MGRLVFLSLPFTGRTVELLNYMEFLQEAIASRNIVVWIILVVLLILFIKILKSAGKGIVMLIILIGVIALLAKMFPDFLAPIVDFVRGGWLGDQRPDRPW